MDFSLARPIDLVTPDDIGQEDASHRDFGCWGTCHGVQYLATSDHGGGKQHDEHNMVLDSLCSDCVRMICSLPKGSYHGVTADDIVSIVTPKQVSV